MDGIIDSIDMNLSKLWEMVKDGKLGMLQSMGLERLTEGEGDDRE